MPKIPVNHNWIKFHHKDWLIDGSLRKLDNASRAIWMDIFCFSMMGDEQGIISGHDTKSLSKVLGHAKREFERAFNKLIEAGLCQLLEDGTVIVSQILIRK